MRQGLERRDVAEPLLASGSRAARQGAHPEGRLTPALEPAYLGQSIPAHALAVPICVAPLAFA